VRREARLRGSVGWICAQRLQRRVCLDAALDAHAGPRHQIENAQHG